MRSRVAATSSVARVSRRTGASAVRATSHEAQRGRRADAAERDEDQDRAQAVERLVHFRERSRDLHGVAGSGVGNREDANVGVGDLGIAVERILRPGGDLARALVDRGVRPCPLGTYWARRPVELDVPAWAAELGPGNARKN